LFLLVSKNVARAFSPHDYSEIIARAD